MNFTPERLRKLKPKFDKLTYDKKLLFWDKYFWDEKKDFFFSFSWSYFFNEIETEEERLKPEHSITIYPSDGKENEMCNSWLFNHIQSEPHYNIEKQKEKYFENLKDNPRPIEFIESEISPIIKQRDKEKKLMEAKSNIFCWGFYYGYQSVVQNEKRPPRMEAKKFYKIAIGYTKGVCDAYYLGFLEEQLETIRQGNKALFLKNEKPKGEDITIEQVYEIFNSIDLDKELLNQKILKNPGISINKDTFQSDVVSILTQVLEQYKAQTSKLNNENKLAHLKERLKPFPKTTKVVTSKYEGEMEQVYDTVTALLIKFYTAEYNLITSNVKQINSVQPQINLPNNHHEKTQSDRIAFRYKKKGLEGDRNLVNFKNNLIDSDFIDKSTLTKNFKAVFRNKSPLQPIKWKTSIIELSYMIKRLHNELKLVEDAGYDKWKITAKCFIDNMGNPFDWKKFRRQQLPKKQAKSELDKILNKL